MTETQPDLQYDTLREQIEGILSEGKVHTQRAGEWAKVEAYWHIGDALQIHFRGNSRAEYGQQVVRNLSNDIGLSESQLWDILLFRRSLPILSTSRELSWSHIREVLRVATREQRLFYLRAADEGTWTIRQLREAIKADAYGRHADQPLAVQPDEDPGQDQTLRARFGELDTYKMVPGGDPASDEPFLDLGFGVTCRARNLGTAGAEPDQIVTITQASGNTLTFAPRPLRTRRYTYPAWIQRVIDGDTLISIVDLGFDHQTRPQRFRLRGIDCPELATLAGRTTKAFVQEALSQVGFVVLTTHATDAYGRYLADIRYLPGEPSPQVVRRRGRYLSRAPWLAFTRFQALRTFSESTTRSISWASRAGCAIARRPPAPPGGFVVGGECVTAPPCALRFGPSAV